MTTPPAAEDFELLAAAVDEAVKAANSLDGTARKVADALRESIEAAHRAAFVTIVRRLRADEAGRALLYELVDDPLIHLLFSLHGIIRADPMTEGRAALDQVRPGLQSHGGDVELVRIEEGTAYVRLSGACNGCSMASVTMRTTVEQALIDGCSTVSSVEVLPAEPTPTVIPLSALRRREDPPSAETGWVDALPSAEIPDGRVTAVQLRDPRGALVDVVIVRIGPSLSAYRNACAHLGMPLDDAELDVERGELICSWHGFCYDALGGECVTAPGTALEQFPLRVENGHVWVRALA